MNVQRIDPGSRIYKAAKQFVCFLVQFTDYSLYETLVSFLSFSNFGINLMKLCVRMNSFEIKNSRDGMRVTV